MIEWTLALLLIQDHQHQHEKPAHETHEMEGALGLPPSRQASGTAWQPDSTPMHGLHFMVDDWMLMFHESVFAGYDYQSGDHGGDQWISTNWFMLMARNGGLTLRTMLSVEPLTTTVKGYPLLLQTGESFKSEPLHDRQHPHDLFMELAAMYEHSLSDEVAFQLYLAPVGEPAVGPVAFPHRLSASSDPLAPLSHHWQDSTHITYGVVTAGVFTKTLKLEASGFNGREPDEHRYDFDFRPLDSYSVRVSTNPNPSWSFQASFAYLDSPEELEPDVSDYRVTASACYTVANWAFTFVWGRNIAQPGPDSDSILLEASWDLDEHHTVFGRAEYIGKPGHDLGILDDRVFDIGEFVAGYLYRLGPVASIVPAVGFRFSFNVIEERLKPIYGEDVPFGFMVFVRLMAVSVQDHEQHDHRCRSD